MSGEIGDAAFDVGPDTFGWTRMGGGAEPLRTPEGRAIVDLQGIALRSPRDSAQTIGHEIWHVAFGDQENHTAADNWAAHIMRRSRRQ